MIILVESSGASVIRNLDCSRSDQIMDFYVLSNLIPSVENKDIFNITPIFFFILTKLLFYFTQSVIIFGLHSVSHQLFFQNKVQVIFLVCPLPTLFAL